MSNNPEEEDDEAAISRAQPAIDSVLRTYRRKFALDKDDADEIAAEARLTLLTRRRQNGAGRIDALEAYAVGVTRNLVKLLFRQRRRRRTDTLALLPDDMLADVRPPGQTGVEQRLDLKRIWRQIEALSPQHRAALLLGMRSSGGAHCAGLLVLLDVVSTDDLAKAMGVSTGELEDSLWDELPLDDVRIAVRLDVTQRQVIDLRKSARRSLTASYKRSYRR
jgi:DNA-directed RNA polymerase specialized sigma24 family protein